mmetsp:Transcript_11657/g.16968  ORF Transcript_11657/g.16968 Transcript_11657/m.16968 type:complete len:210 (-) Transcript_11657:378-1007(-)
MKVLIQNLQKKKSLATHLQNQYNPDLMLLQEINLPSESLGTKLAHFTSMNGYGTAIYFSGELKEVQKVKSPHAEIGGFIYKKTTIATTIAGEEEVQCIIFHGYNGQPFQSIDKLAAHVQTVLSLLSSSTSKPIIFAGDFNTWTNEHVNAVTNIMDKAGLQLLYSWPYPGREVPLDHVFGRGVDLRKVVGVLENEADHLGVLLDLEVKKR